MKPPNDQPPEDGLAEDLARLNDWQDALAAMGQPSPCDEVVEGPTEDARAEPNESDDTGSTK
ncbi:hypothetical protein ACIBQ1_10095 [Nonomuraea sp. NPDC050153]|uniref:hypothetical protein n=1 Tax=Nonomuraea sp. NPDC050153 TaxID=3364359 RepID=UPI0037B864D1